jgi:amidase
MTTSSSSPTSSLATPIHRRPATVLGAQIARGEVSSLEVTDAFLARITAHNEPLQAFVHVAARQARRAARAFDAQRRRGAPPASPLAGVPIGIKDLSPVRFMPLKAGSRALGPFVSPVDGANVRRLRRAGVVILGKLATAEFGAMPYTEPDVHGPTRNPWDLTTTAGGSSGGTGAALAAGLVPVGHGSDGGGSIRIPSALCGVFGFKPGRGALHHVTPEPLGLSTEGPLAWCVDDAVALLQVLAVDDRFARPVELPRGLRVGVLTASSEPARAPVDAGIAVATERVAALFAGAHHVVARGALPLGVDDFLPLWQHTIAAAPIPRLLEKRLQPITQWLRAAGKQLVAADAHTLLARLTATLDGWWGDLDLLVLPTVSCRPPAVGSWRDPDPARGFARAVPLGVFTAPWNASGQPAISVPVVVDGDPHPVGVQVVARRGADALLVAVARFLETALGGFAHRPPAYP